jgi:dienelactone hydrolase
MRTTIAVLVLTWCATVRAADYSADGPLAVTVSSLTGNGGKLVRPTTGGPYPLLVAAHGFSASSDNQLGWAKHFATHGFVVVVPNFAGTDHAANGKLIQDLIAMHRDPAMGVGIEGHSAGGLAAAIAAAGVQPGATVLFDPVDNGDLGKQAMPKIAGPLLQIFAEPGACNNQGAWKPFKSSSSGPQVIFDVKGSTHCDGENADRGVLCGFACGGAAMPARQARYSHYATAFLLAFLKSDAVAAGELCPAKLSADPSLAAVVSQGVPGCGGAASVDMSLPGLADAAIAVDAGTGSTADLGAGAPRGGCALSSSGDASVWWMVVLLGLSAAGSRWRARRRR